MVSLDVSPSAAAASSSSLLWFDESPVYSHSLPKEVRAVQLLHSRASFFVCLVLYQHISLHQA